MMVAYGGLKHLALNDTWSLTRHRDGHWDQVKHHIKISVKYNPKDICIQYIFRNFDVSYMRKINFVGGTLPFEIYHTEISDWFKFQSSQRFRHSQWLVDQLFYLHGGFDSYQPNISTEGILRLDLNKRFAKTISLLRQINATRFDAPPLVQTQDQFRRMNQHNHHPETIMIINNSFSKLKKLWADFQYLNSQNKLQFLDQLCWLIMQNLLIPKDDQQIPPNSNLLTGIKKIMIIKLCDENQLF